LDNSGDNSTLPINDIFTVNARAWLRVASDIQLYANANNLLDRRYVMYATDTTNTGLFRMPGLMITGGAKYSFGG